LKKILLTLSILLTFSLVLFVNPGQTFAASIPTTFQWGVTMRPYALGSYSKSGWTKQIVKAKSLGAGWARITWDYNGKPFVRNTEVINTLIQNKINVVLVIEHNPNDGNNNLYKNGYNDGKCIAKYYKKKVAYYQLMNEGGAQSLKNGTSNGQTMTDYNVNEYNKVRDYMKGLSDGISAGDPSAKKIVTISWTHVGFLDRLVKDGVKFDMIGIDWYDWMGDFGSSKLSNGQSLYEKLKSYGKPLTFMEVAAMPKGANASSKSKTIVDETKQNSFTMQTAQWAWDHRDTVKGFYAFELVDNISNPSQYKDYYGLIQGVKKGSNYTFGKLRKVFTSYKTFIKAHKK